MSRLTVFPQCPGDSYADAEEQTGAATCRRSCRSSDCVGRTGAVAPAQFGDRPKSKRGDFGQRLAEGVHRAVEQDLAALGRRAGRITDQPAGTEVVGQPAERDGAAEAHVTVGGERLRHVAEPGCEIDQLRPQVEHQRGLLEAAVDAHAQLLLRTGAAMVGRQAGMGEKGLQPELQAELAARGVQQRGVAAVAVEEHQPARRASRRRSDRRPPARSTTSAPRARTCPPTRRARWTS